MATNESGWRTNRALKRAGFGSETAETDRTGQSPLPVAGRDWDRPANLTTKSRRAHKLLGLAVKKILVDKEKQAAQILNELLLERNNVTHISPGRTDQN